MVYSSSSVMINRQWDLKDTSAIAMTTMAHLIAVSSAYHRSPVLVRFWLAVEIGASDAGVKFIVRGAADLVSLVAATAGTDDIDRDLDLEPQAAHLGGVFDYKPVVTIAF